MTAETHYKLIKIITSPDTLVELFSLPVEELFVIYYPVDALRY